MLVQWPPPPLSYCVLTGDCPPMSEHTGQDADRLLYLCMFGWLLSDRLMYKRVKCWPVSGKLALRSLHRLVFKGHQRSVISWGQKSPVRTCSEQVWSPPEMSIWSLVSYCQYSRAPGTCKADLIENINGVDLIEHITPITGHTVLYHLFIFCYKKFCFSNRWQGQIDICFQLQWGKKTREQDGEIFLELPSVYRGFVQNRMLKVLTYFQRTPIKSSNLLRIFIHLKTY